jgi:aspartyl-tRNA(Asn)/glutamyl-tRNA(Gln) amidotransferase subunit B
MEKYLPTIGLEIHAELNTKSKMFCGCKNDPHSEAANSNVCPVCLAHPGTLPSVNYEAVKKVLLVGKALGGVIADYSEFDRKNYFYPDIPKAYQLSQYAYPFVKGGELFGVKITRVHLEEDTARSQHDEGSDSLVDFNRAGVPLMELVTEPVIHDSVTAGAFARELQLLLRTLGVSEANMEKGEMRVEANISVSQSETFGTKVEVKNLNSFKSVEQAIDFEIKRQVELLEKGEKIKQETRGWDEVKSRTFSQRSKETAEDYRYFPDPDIPKFALSEINDFDSSRLEEIMPDLPSKIRHAYRDLGLKNEQIESLVFSRDYLNFFNKVIILFNGNSKLSQLAANYLTSDIFGLLQNDKSKSLVTAYADEFAKLMILVSDEKITSRVAKDLLSEVVFGGAEPEKLATEKGLIQSNSADNLLPVVQIVIKNNPTVVADYLSGKEAALQFLLGQVMKETKGGANPKLISEMLKAQIQ